MVTIQLRRYVPLMLWVMAVLTILVIPLKIIGYGFLPLDDALRHAAKVVSGKSWQEILVMHDGITMDIHPGWHAILGAIHQATRWDQDALVSLSVAGLLLVFGCSVLPFVKRPETWLAVLLISIVAWPGIMRRWSLGRPYIVTMTCLIVVLLLWSKLKEERPSRKVLTLTSLLVAASVWIHGSWYLWTLPLAAFLLARQWRHGSWFIASGLMGILIGGTLTGHPYQFLAQAISVLMGCFSDFWVQRTLVGEFQPTDGVFQTVITMVLVFIWKASRGRLNTHWARDPILMMAIIGWLLGLKVSRFWYDWGMPAALAWLLREIEEELELGFDFDSCNRLLFGSLVSLGLYFTTTSDLESRYTYNLTTDYLTLDNPKLAGWMPETNGIIYSASMIVFYQTFFKNPKAPWRYLLGFEATLMPQEDLDIYRKILWNYGANKAYEPWINKMRQADRLVIRAGKSNQPTIAGLEWYYGATDTWIGRLPRATNAPPVLK